MTDALRPAAALPAVAPRADTAGRRFARAAREAGFVGATARSGRVTHASELTRAGTTTQVMLSSGWRSARMVARYAAGARAERGAVAKYL